MAAAFEPSHFEKLHRVLKDSIASPARVSNSNDWYIAIDRSKADLVDLARAKRPNEAEKREIQSGECGGGSLFNEDGYLTSFLFSPQAKLQLKELHIH